MAVTRLLHIIPVGNSEPVHDANIACWCHPLRQECTVVHNAKDCREARERLNISTGPESRWVLIGELEST